MQFPTSSKLQSSSLPWPFEEKMTMLTKWPQTSPLSSDFR